MRENEYLINTIQEITLQAYAFGVYNYLQDERNMSRTDIFQLFVEWAEDFEKTHENFDWMQGSFYDEVDDYLGYKFDSMKVEDKVKEAFPYGIAVNDHISYNGGIYLITGFSEQGILVKEVGGVLDSEWETTEIGFSQSDKVKILPNYEDIMDTTNSHNPELVAKINIAWNEKREMFFPIMCALYKRDIEEIMDSDAFTFPWEHKYTADDAYLYLAENWDIETYNYLQHIADDTDLECILNYLHAQ
jgi:hypothetical protein